MPVLERRRRSRVKPQSAWLLDHRHDVQSQFGEDGLIRRLFGAIGARNKWCVEFGAWDGKHLSNSWNLIVNEGWNGVLIEGDPERHGTIARTYAEIIDRITALNAFVGWAGENRLDALLSRTSAPHDFDLLSIDIDGNDWHVWRSLEAYHPAVVVVEFNPTIPNDVYFVQDASADINQGCSLLALIDLARDKGYQLAAATLCNGIFVDGNLFGKLGISDNDIDAMYDCQLDISVFQTFDGVLHGAGHMHLLWHDLPIMQDDLQILPQALRRYPG